MAIGPEQRSAFADRSRRTGFIPFELKFRLPKFHKERIIFDPSISLRVSRDEFGKIVLSKVSKRRLFR